ncbi:META domain-containing protein [Sphingomonas sp. S1-29]|uniref:META domain-containing protein n=1 Tax=Sphingomonas sp. S1-29 TaxID=2991074 RepID=UPI00223FAD81|nr:META domain-containing protein [Sphingomonas sp. S1-29]UZK68816.1 META domain-containing protein [Sphingomonas sp. S1-29]
MPRIQLAAAIAAILSLTACATADRAPLMDDVASAAALQSGEWKVETVAGSDVSADSNATLLFAADGKLSGNASCNRLIANYVTEGGMLAISDVGTTRMTCSAALMEQERRLVELLAGVSGYQIDAAGTLTLTSQSGAVVVARR